MNSVILIGFFATIWILVVDAYGPGGYHGHHQGVGFHHGPFHNPHNFHHSLHQHPGPHFHSHDSSEDAWEGKSEEDFGPSFEENYGDWPDHRTTDEPSRRKHKYPPFGKFPKYNHPIPNKPYVTEKPFTPSLMTYKVPDRTESFTFTPTATREPLPTRSTSNIPSVRGDATLDSEIMYCVSKCMFPNNDKPVCGSDGTTYKNIGHLICAQQCGANVELQLQSSCPEDWMGAEITTDSFRSRTTELTEHQKCMKQCRLSPEYAPVCGTDYVTYINRERLDCAKQCGRVLNILCEKPCSACNESPPTTTASTTKIPGTYSPQIIQCLNRCPITSEYNPVCGSDGVSYFNPGRLTCAQICGIKVTAEKLFPCPSFNTYKTTLKWITFHYTTPSRSYLRTCYKKCVLTPDFNPVCGSNNVSYKNPSILECAKHCGVRVELARNSACGVNAETVSEPPNTIPLDVLSSVFGDFNVTSPLPPTSDDDYDLDVRFGDNNTTPAVPVKQKRHIINPILLP